MITINRSLTIKESTPCLSEHALWSLNRYDFGVKVNLKKVEKTHVLMMLTPNLSVDSILRFVLIVLQYIEQTYQIYWYLIGMSVGMFVWNCVGLLVIRGYDSSRVRKV